MNRPMPRRLWLSGSQTDGDEARAFDFVIDQPMDCDLDVIPGQFFMLSVPGTGEAPFSYLDLPDSSGSFQALIRRDGAVASALFAQEPGAILGYRGPYGNGWPLLIGRHKVLAFAADRCLIALASFFEEALGWHLPVNLTLMHVTSGHPSPALSAAKDRWKEVFQVVETPGEDKSALWLQRRPLSHLEQVLDNERPDTVLCCAPEELMQAFARMCTAKGIQPNNIWLLDERRMPSGIRSCGHRRFDISYICPDGPIYRYDRYRQQMDICESYAYAPREDDPLY